MKIIKSQDYLNSLKTTLTFISQDKKSAAINFNLELNKKVKELKSFPRKYAKSKYFDQEDIRDLMYKGYSVPYIIKEESIIIIGITKYTKSLKNTSLEEINNNYGKKIQD